MERVAVIGAGAAGLAAAHFLAERGYQDVVVLEAEDRVGGKACTVVHEDRPYDLGACLISPSYRYTIELARRYGVALLPHRLVEENVVFDRAAAQWVELRAAVRGAHSSRSYLGAFARVAGELRRHSDFLTAPALTTPRADLSTPFDAWTRRHGVHPLTTWFRRFVVGMGYGPLEETPAAYVLRYLATVVRRPRSASFLKAALEGYRAYTPAGGFQALLDAMAARLDVRVACPVTRVDRAGPRVQVWMAGDDQPLEVDRLVVATNLAGAAGLLDATPAEREVLEQLRCTDYVATLARTAGLPPKTGVVYHDDGLALTLRASWEDRPLRVLYQYGRGDTDAAIDDRLERDLRATGGRLVEIVSRRRWQYFPRVSGDALAAGWADRLRALQGQNGTFYTGSACTAETVEATVRHAAALVAEHFPAIGPAREAAPADEPRVAAEALA